MTTAKVLVVDDDQEMRNSLAHLLESAGYVVHLAKDAMDGFEAIQSFEPDVVISDVRMPGTDGLEFQKMVREVDHVPVILMSAHGDIPMAVSALQDGAYSFVEKPAEPRRMMSILKNAVRMKRLLDSTVFLQGRLAELTDLERILIGNSPEIVAVRDQIFDFAVSKANVLILGDTGTGKELVARALHDLGSASKAQFVPVNCAAIPPERFEETVFGTCEAPRGLMSAANTGTLFLDELSSMPLETQSKFLRTIETMTYQRIGEAEVQKVDLRVISAASRQITQHGSDKTFREDLLFRLNTLVIELPSLADRGEAIGLKPRFPRGKGDCQCVQKIRLCDSCAKRIQRHGRNRSCFDLFRRRSVHQIHTYPDCKYAASCILPKAFQQDARNLATV